MDISSQTGEAASTPKSNVKRYLPLAVIAVALGGFFAFGGHNYISLDSLRENQNVLNAFVANNTILAVIGLISLYALLTAISFPGASFLSIFAGFLFGVTTGTVSVVIGATIGATIIFLIARSALGDGLAKRAGPFMKKFEKGLKEDEFSYLFILRLVPLFPFFIVNIVPALFDVKLRNYILTTFLGIIPGALVYVSVGNGARAALAVGEDVPLSGLMFKPAVIGPILGLIILSLIPVVYKKLSSKKN